MSFQVAASRTLSGLACPALISKLVICLWETFLHFVKSPTKGATPSLTSGNALRNYANNLFKVKFLLQNGWICLGDPRQKGYNLVQPRLVWFLKGTGGDRSDCLNHTHHSGSWGRFHPSGILVVGQGAIVSLVRGANTLYKPGAEKRRT